MVIVLIFSQKHTYSAFGKVFRPLDVLHILLSYSFILKWIQ
jgi:hypothetical protein